MVDIQKINDIAAGKCAPDGYCSHLPVLDKVIAYIRPDRALEYGAGLWSTPYLTQRVTYVRTVETVHAWIDDVRKELPAVYGRWDVVHPADELSEATGNDEQWDLVFVDGTRDARHHIIQHTMDKGLAKVIVAHDAERAEYKYDLINLSEGWGYTIVKCAGPWCIVISKDPGLHEWLTSYPTWSTWVPGLLAARNYPVLK
jgi:hypothetical protein